MDDLMQFLRARLDETATKARTHRQASASWYYDDAAGEIRDETNSGTVAFVPSAADAQHIAEHDPARILAEVDAKEVLLRVHGPAHDCAADRDGVDCATEEEPCLVLRLLALPYALHPAHRPEWAPNLV
ncbi:DUF6221 family protein [Streptomyces sp. NPDC051555]|uniref:DUF6221 family protein n=1 Tax=Streptomyces sp. NPDC051555 TaxID=3365657 RepID=UPI0037BAF3F2